MPGPIPVCTIDAAGIHRPAFADIEAAAIGVFRGIFGSDIVVDNDTQDGQWLRIWAQSISDANDMAVAVYNAFSPSTAQGVGLSRVVKINGIERAVASYSNVDVTCIGQAGTVIANGLLTDLNGNRWALPATVVIPLNGTIDVSAICQTPGAILAPAGTLSIQTPTQGWQSATNAADATPGAPIELDPLLRIRQSKSTMNPSTSMLEGMIGDLLALPGVASVRAYENATDSADGNGIPSHSVAFVIDGGEDRDIVDTIWTQRCIGMQTYGTTHQTVVDEFGISHTISFFRPTSVVISGQITLKALTGYSTAVQAEIQSAMATWLSGLGVGALVSISRAGLPANLYGAADSVTFEPVAQTGVMFKRGAGSFAAVDLQLAFNEKPISDPTNINIVEV